jgi:hypothetical protein
MEKSSSLGMPMHNPKKYPRSTTIKAWGCPRGTPSSSAKIRSPFKTLLHALYVFLGASVVLVFLVSLVLFASINGWTPTNFLWRRRTHFYLLRTLRFHSYNFTECSSFSATAFGFHFRLDLHLDLVISFHQGVFLPLIFIGFHQKRYL